MIRRLLLGYVAIVLVLAGALAIPFGVVFANRQREQFAVALERDAVVLASIYEDALEDELELEPAVAHAYGERTDVRVVIVDPDGVSLIDSEDVVPRTFASRPEVESALAGERYFGTRYSSTLGEELFVVSVPVASGSQIHGAVRLTVFNSDVEAQVHRMWLSLGIVVAVAVGASALVGYVVARSVTRPVARLGETAARIADGDLSARSEIADAPKELADLAVTFDDMADRVEMLVESHRSFVADASHQLRTPLTALRLRIENLEATADGKDVDAFGDIVVEVERLSLLVDQLLELSREGTAETVPIDVGDIIEQRVGLWEPVAAERRITLTMNVGARSECAALAIQGALEQILDNLIDNALRYTPENQTVAIRAIQAPADWCSISVVDSGPGVSEEDLTRVFDRFWRGGSGEPGTGLGLAIVAHLVTQSGGTVSASNRPGGGLAVTILLRRGTSTSARG